MASSPAVRRVLPPDPPAARLRQPEGPGPGYLRVMARNVSDATLIGLMVAGFVRWFIKYAFFSYMPIYLAQQMEASAAQIGIIVAIPGLLGAITASQAGRLGTGDAARIGTAASVFGLGAAIVAAAWVPSLAWVYIATVVLGIADGFSGPLVNGFVSVLPPAQVRASVVATSGFFRNFGKAVSPVLVGAILARVGMGTGFALVGLTGLLAPVYLVPLWRRRVSS